MRAEAALADHVHGLRSTRGIHQNDTLLVASEPRQRLARVSESEHLADLAGDKPSLTVVVDGPNDLTIEVEVDGQSDFLAARTAMISCL